MEKGKNDIKDRQTGFCPAALQESLVLLMCVIHSVISNIGRAKHLSRSVVIPLDLKGKGGSEQQP